MGRDDGRQDEDFSRLVHRILISGGNGRIKDVASRLDMGYDNFYARLCGRVAFNVDDVRALFAVMRDVRILEYVIAETEFLIAPRAKGTAGLPQAAMQNVSHQVVYDSVALLRIMADGGGDRKFDHRNRAQARQKVAETERTLATLRLLLEVNAS